MKTKNKILIFFLLVSFAYSFSQTKKNSFRPPPPFQIINEVLDGNGCTTSVDIEYEITNYVASNIYGYQLLRSNGSSSSIAVNNINGNGTYIINNISTNISTNIVFFEYKWVFQGPFPYIISSVLWSTNIIHCSNDIDSDGVLNNIDNCINTYNPNQSDIDLDGIGDVCDPVNNIAKPNLTLGGLNILVNGTTYNVFNSQTPILLANNNVEFQVTINNNDDGDANSSPFTILVSDDPNAYPNVNGSQVFNFLSGNGGSISGNNSTTVNLSKFIFDKIEGYYDPGSTLYFFIHIDPNDEIDESNENNNDNIFMVQFQFTATRIVKLNFGENLIKIPYNVDENKVNKIKIFNSKSFVVFNGSVNSKSDNNNNTFDSEIDLSSLSKGIYYVQFNGKYYKTVMKL